VRNHIFIGLGNPGKKYEMTRHNIGFLVIQAFAKCYGFVFREEPVFHSHIARGKVDDHPVALMMPTTYMNDSGRAVKAYLDYYKLTPADIVVVNDDIALGFGELRLRPSGSSGGHNGLKSVQFYLQTAEYARLRMGIGEHTGHPSLAEYVLDVFDQEELLKLPEFINRGVRALHQLLSLPISQVMNNVNVKLEQYPPCKGAGEVKNE
jgi:peptidyl-tRNA hydrolase, PTH1 family